MGLSIWVGLGEYFNLYAYNLGTRGQWDNGRKPLILNKSLVPTPWDNAGQSPSLETSAATPNHNTSCPNTNSHEL